MSVKLKVFYTPFLVFMLADMSSSTVLYRHNHCI